MNRLGMGAMRVGGQAIRSGGLQGVTRQATKQTVSAGFRTVGQQAESASTCGRSAIIQFAKEFGQQFVKDAGESVFQDYGKSIMTGEEGDIVKIINNCYSVAMDGISNSLSSSNPDGNMCKEFNQL